MWGLNRCMSKSLFKGRGPSLFVVAAWIIATIGTTALVCRAEDSNPSLPSGVQEIVKLVKAGLSEEVVLAQIQRTGVGYNLSVDQIIYLHEQGVTQTEIKALLGGNQKVPTAPTVPASVPPPASTITPAVAPTPIAPPTATVPCATPVPAAQPASLGSFQSQLSPYGA